MLERQLSITETVKLAVIGDPVGIEPVSFKG